MATMRTKVAIIRRPGYPVGRPAPCYLNCPCGAEPPVPSDWIGCSCGRRYDALGWLIRDTNTRTGRS